MLHTVVEGLQLGAHFKGHTGTKGVSPDPVRPVWLQLPDAVHIVRCQSLDAVQRSSWEENRNRLGSVGLVKTQTK